MAGISFWENKYLYVRFEGVENRFQFEKKGKVIPHRGAEDRKGTKTNNGKFAMKNLEAEGIRSRAESTGGGAKLKKDRVYKTVRLKVDTEYIKQFGSFCQFPPNGFNLP